VAPAVVLAGWMAAAAALAVQTAAPEVVARYALWPLLVGIVVVGLPHGALDHLVPARLGFAWGRRPLPLAGFLAAYVGAVAGYGVIWWVAPGSAFIGFLALTIWHWGQGDQRFLELFLGRRRLGRVGTLATILTRGSLPVLVPVLAFPAAADDLLSRASGALGLEAPAWTVADPTLRLVLMALLVGLLAAYVRSAMRAARDARSALLDLGEVALLLGFFATVPAYAAIGVYFLAWHSLRHLVRLLLLRPSEAERVRRGNVAGPVGRLTLDLLPITLAAVAVLIGAAAWAGENLGSVDDFVALYLVLISALTVPHAAVVALMDVRRRS
jgi:Brp/Blh family beta-carotene 15,15'-monooxygenase